MLRFTPSAFLDLLERERRWCELLLTAMSIRAELRTMEALSLADDLILQALERRVQALRN
jgi:membrane glycosyltransferase